MSFSPDGTRLLSRDGKGQALFWDLKTGEVLPDGLVEEFAAGKDSGKTPDGRWLVIPSITHVLSMDLAYENSPRVWQRRKMLARSKPRWHTQQFQAAQSAKQWYVAVFHAAWLLKITPSDASLHDAHRQLLAAHNGQRPPLPALVVEVLKLPRGTDLPSEANN